MYYSETYAGFVIPIHTFTNTETLVKMGPVVGDIFGEIGRIFCSLIQKGAFITLVISGVTVSIFILFTQNVANILPFNIFESE